jgi:hypothetical protein
LSAVPEQSTQRASGAVAREIATLDALLETCPRLSAVPECSEATATGALLFNKSF